MTKRNHELPPTPAEKHENNCYEPLSFSLPLISRSLRIRWFKDVVDFVLFFCWDGIWLYFFVLAINSACPRPEASPRTTPHSLVSSNYHVNLILHIELIHFPSPISIFMWGDSQWTHLYLLSPSYHPPHLMFYTCTNISTHTITPIVPQKSKKGDPSSRPHQYPMWLLPLPISLLLCGDDSSCYFYSW